MVLVLFDNAQGHNDDVIGDCQHWILSKCCDISLTISNLKNRPVSVYRWVYREAWEYKVNRALEPSADISSEEGPLSTLQWQYVEWNIGYRDQTFKPLYNGSTCEVQNVAILLFNLSSIQYLRKCQVFFHEPLTGHIEYCLFIKKRIFYFLLLSTCMQLSL